MALVDEFVDRLGWDGSVRRLVAPGHVVIERWQGTRLDPEVSVRFDPATFERDVTVDDETRRTLWPEMDASHAGLNLLFVHLDEVIQTGRVSGGQLVTGDLVIGDLGLVWPDARQPGAPRPGVPQPGTPQPGTPQPGTPQPGTPQPGVPHPGTPQPGMQEGAASAGQDGRFMHAPLSGETYRGTHPQDEHGRQTGNGTEVSGDAAVGNDAEDGPESRREHPPEE